MSDLSDDDDAYEDRERDSIEADRQHEAQVASAKRVRRVVLECCSEADAAYASGHVATVRERHQRIADRVAAQLTAPPPGHVCPVPYGLGPEDVDVLEWLRRLAVAGDGFSTMTDPVSIEYVARCRRGREVLDKILAMHRAPHS